MLKRFKMMCNLRKKNNENITFIENKLPREYENVN